MPRKVYTDVIALLDESANLVAFLSYGHASPTDFCAWVKAQHDYEINPESVRHILARWVPNPNQRLGSVFVEARAPGRGAFEATYAENLS